MIGAVGSYTKLAVVLMITAVLFSNAQCLASCTAASCNNGVPARSSEDIPPCHHHPQKTPTNHSALAPCHDFVLPGTSPSIVAQILLTDALIAVSPVSANMATQSVAAAEASETHGSPPPLASVSASAVLRI